jgi:hypothetical protein
VPHSNWVVETSDYLDGEYGAYMVDHIGIHANGIGVITLAKDSETYFAVFDASTHTDYGDIIGGGRTLKDIIAKLPPSHILPATAFPKENQENPEDIPPTLAVNTGHYTDCGLLEKGIAKTVLDANDVNVMTTQDILDRLDSQTLNKASPGSIAADKTRIIIEEAQKLNAHAGNGISTHLSSGFNGTRNAENGAGLLKQLVERNVIAKAFVSQTSPAPARPTHTSTLS